MLGFLFDALLSGLTGGIVGQYAAGMKLARKYIYGAAAVAGAIAAVVTPW